jgi:hypothetical protein
LSRRAQVKLAIKVRLKEGRFETARLTNGGFKPPLLEDFTAAAL